MFEVDLGVAVVESLAKLTRIERKGDKINLVFVGENGSDVFLTASAMRDGDVWTVKELGPQSCDEANAMMKTGREYNRQFKVMKEISSDRWSDAWGEEVKDMTEIESVVFLESAGYTLDENAWRTPTNALPNYQINEVVIHLMRNFGYGGTFHSDENHPTGAYDND